MIVTGDEVEPYLSDFRSRGFGRVRGGEVSRAKVSRDGDDVVVDVQHSTFGSYVIRFEGVTLGLVSDAATRFYGLPEDDEGVDDSDIGDLSGDFGVTGALHHGVETVEQGLTGGPVHVSSAEGVEFEHVGVADVGDVRSVDIDDEGFAIAADHDDMGNSGVRTSTGVSGSNSSPDGGHSTVEGLHEGSAGSARGDVQSAACGGVVVGEVSTTSVDGGLPEGLAGSLVSHGGGSGFSGLSRAERQHLQDWDDMISMMQLGTWEIDLNKGTLDVSRENVFGYSYGRFEFAYVVVDVEQVRADDGSCKVCGALEFSLKSFGFQPLRSVGDGLFVSTGPAVLSLLNSSPKVVCTQCGTEHYRSGTFKDGYMVDERVSSQWVYAQARAQGVDEDEALADAEDAEGAGGVV